MANNSIAQLFPVEESEEHRIQADIPHTLFLKADRLRRERRLKWNQVMQVLLKKFVEDLSPQNVSERVQNVQ